MDTKQSVEIAERRPDRSAVVSAVPPDRAEELLVIRRLLELVRQQRCMKIRVYVGQPLGSATRAAWKAHSQRLVAQQLGIERWYAHYEGRVAKVERAYSGPTGRAPGKS